jgi:hypothetical protein
MREFDGIIADVKKGCVALLASPSYSMENLPRVMPQAGIYLLSENRKAVYVGRSSYLRKRLQNHRSNSHNKASLAFLMAREETGRTKASYKPDGSRSALLRDSLFRTAFDNARARIRKMHVQFIEVENPVKQALLEIYTAFYVKAEFNDFENH